MEKIFSRIGDFGVDGLGAFFVARALCYGKSSFVLPEYARVLDSAAVGHCGEGFKAKINADCRGNDSLFRRYYLDLKANMPDSSLPSKYTGADIGLWGQWAGKMHF